MKKVMRRIMLLACLCFPALGADGLLKDYIQEAFGRERESNDALFLSVSGTCHQAVWIIGVQSSQLVRVQEKLEQPRRTALCVGIDNYFRPQDRLPGSVNGAKMWRGTLQSRGYTVTTLFDAQATKAGFTVALSNLLTSARAGDFCVVTMDCHGGITTDNNGDEADSKDETTNLYSPTSVHEVMIDDELGRMLDQWLKPGVRLMMFWSTCHAGTNARDDIRAVPPPQITTHPYPYTFFGACPAASLSYQRRCPVKKFWLGMGEGDAVLHLSDLTYWVTRKIQEAPDTGITIQDLYVPLMPVCPGPPVLEVNSSNLTFRVFEKVRP